MSRARVFSIIQTSGQSRRAFTLLELMVVIFIIGLLIAATLTIVPKVKTAVYGAQTNSQLAAIASAINMYYADNHNTYPGPLPNSQLDSSYDSSLPPYIVDPSYNKVPLVGTDGTNSGTQTMASFATAKQLDSTHITGAENLVLGLCGGLRVVANTSTTPYTYTYEYHPEDLFAPDGMSPAVKGATSLNPIAPKRSAPYYTPKSGELSVPNTSLSSTGQFTDSAGRHGTDSVIPELVDRYPEPLPILYYRTNISGTAIVGFRNTNGTATSLGQPLNNNGPPNLVAQYDLCQSIGYTNSAIATKATNHNSFHGLNGLGNLTDTIDTNASGTYSPSNGGSNGVTYFADPTQNPRTPAANTNNASNVYQGVARQKDGFLLISAGPDRLYGTHDDLIYPGPLIP